MNLFDLFEAATPPTRYGYWIDPMGDCIPVGFHEHESVIEQQASLSMDEALEQGWIRVVTRANPERPALTVDMFAGRPGVRAVSALRRICRMEDFRYYEVELGMAQNTDMPAWQKFEQQSAFLAHIQKAVRLPVAEAATIPDTDYGYWIDPQGNYYPVPHQQHWRVIKLVTLEKFGYMMNNHSAMREGWIRVIDDGNGEFSVEVYAHRQSIRALSALKRIAANPVNDTFLVSVHEADRNSDLGYGKSFTDLSDFLRYMQQVRQPSRDPEEPISEAAVPASEYGYWIKADGEIVPVESYGHEPYLRSIGAGWGPRAYQFVRDLGWIRVVNPNGGDIPTLMFQFKAGTLSRRAIMAARRVALSQEAHNYSIDVVANHAADMERDYRSFSQLAPVVAFLQTNLATKPVSEPDSSE